MARVLIAEDEAFTALALVDLLTEQGHTVQDAPDGAIAIDMLRSFEADVLITDLMMPNMSGDDLIRQLRAQPGRQIAVILISGVPEGRLPDDIPYDSYLSKPIDHVALGHLVKRLAPNA